MGELFTAIGALASVVGAVAAVATNRTRGDLTRNPQLVYRPLAAFAGMIFIAVGIGTLPWSTDPLNNVDLTFNDMFRGAAAYNARDAVGELDSLASDDRAKLEEQPTRLEVVAYSQPVWVYWLSALAVAVAASLWIFIPIAEGPRFFARVGSLASFAWCAWAVHKIPTDLTFSDGTRMISDAGAGGYITCIGFALIFFSCGPWEERVTD